MIGPLHAACCCGCPASFDVTIAGIDGNPCGCQSGAGQPQSDFEILTTTNINGSYTISSTPTEVSDGGNIYCRYSALFSETTTSIDYINWTSDDGSCSGTNACQHTETDWRIVLEIWKSSRKLRRIWVDPQTAVCNLQGWFFDSDTQSHPGITLGTTMNNALTCGTYETPQVTSVPGCGVGTSVIVETP